LLCGFGVRKNVDKKLELDNMYEDEIRTNPELIAMIETGEDVNGYCAELEVIEISYNATDYYLKEYDGMESIIYILDGKLYWVGE
jgi:hypothetical protein